MRADWRDDASARRAFEQNVPRLVAFSRAVAALTPDAWDRIDARCAEFAGDSLGAVFGRARAAAAPYNFFERLEQLGARSTAAKAIQGSVSAFLTGWWAGAELLAEFEPPATSAPVITRSKRSGDPSMDACVDAMLALHAVLEPLTPTRPAAVTAVNAGAEALLRHALLTSERFARIYAYVEPEIPYASLDAGAQGP